MSEDGAAQAAPTPADSAAGVLSETQAAADQAASTPAPPVDTSGKWYSAVNESHHGYIENKGWQSMDAVLESYTNLEKMRGIPENELVRIPSTPESDGWAEVYNRLGRPESADQYNIEGLDDGDFGSWFKNSVHEAGLSNQQAAQLAKQYDTFATEQQNAANEKMQQESAVAMDELRNQWGRDAEANFEMAARGAKFLGLDQEKMTVLEREWGTKFLMETALNAGRKLSEGEFVTSDSITAANARPTQAEAQAKYKAMNADPEFRKRLLSDDPKVRQAAMEERSIISKLAFDG